jgi:hypothetical protein
MRKPTPVIANEEKLAEITGPAEQLLEALRDEAYDQGRFGAVDVPRREGYQSPADALRALIKDLAGRATFRVYVQTMRESHRITYWTTIVSSFQSCLDSRSWHKGRITPFYSETLEHAEYEADNWAAFLGVEAEPWVKPEWHDELVAEFDAKRLAAGKTGSGSHPEVGARLDDCAQQEAEVARQQGSLWHPIASVPRDGSAVDFWNGTNRILNMRYLRAEEVNVKFAKGGCWEHLAQHGFRSGADDESVLVETNLTHWRYSDSDRPFPN